jgi:hypothetical protein
MGAIVFWGLVRIAILMPTLWLLYGVVEYKYWWTILVLSVYGIVIHPAVIQYNLFMEKNKEIIHNTLCSSCKYFDKSAVLCLKHDQHPTLDNLPCGGIDWEMKENDYEQTESYL